MDSLLSSFLAACILILLSRCFIARQTADAGYKTSDAAPGPNRHPGVRIAWIDCAKGLTMLLVILGHTINTSQEPFNHVLRGLIFSFHMPLFFILSGTTSGMSADREQFVLKTERNFKHLVCTAYLLFGLNVLILLHGCEIHNWKTFLTNTINTAVYGSGIDVRLSASTIPAFGMEWFLLVMFGGKTLYDYLHLKLSKTGLGLAAVLCALAGTALGSIQWLPWSLDITLAVLPFFLFGSFLKDLHQKRGQSAIFAGALIIWLAVFYVQYSSCHDYLRLSSRVYPLFPLCYITAAAGTVVTACISGLLSSCRAVKLLPYLGRYSLYLYCAHILDYLSLPLWFRTDSIYINNLLRTSIDIIVCIVLVQAVNFIKSKTAAAPQTP